MNATENKIIGYFLKHKDATFSQLTSDTLINVHEAHEAMLSLQAKGIIKGRGFASHTESYYVVGGKGFLSDENLGVLFINRKVV